MTTPTSIAAPDGAATFPAASTPAADGALPVDSHWSGFGGAHGGLMVAAAARAMANLAPQGAQLRSVHANLLGAVAPGELTLRPQLDRSGRTVSFASVRGEQDGRTRLTATAVFGTSAPGLAYGPAPRAAAPAAPRPDQLEPWHVEDGPALATIEFRPSGIGPRPLEGGDVADLLVWVRVAGDPAPLDVFRILTLLDAPAPGLYGVASAPLPVPTVEFSAHLLPAIAGAPSPWALVRMQTASAGDGYCIDDAELWDERGELLATARQLRRVIAG